MLPDKVEVIMKTVDKNYEESINALSITIAGSQKEVAAMTKAAMRMWKQSDIRKGVHRKVSKLHDEQFGECQDKATSMKRELRKAFAGFMKSLPANKGGRPKKLSTDARRRVVAEIASLLPDMSLKEAIVRVSEHYKIKSRYAEKIWQDRC